MKNSNLKGVIGFDVFVHF